MGITLEGMLEHSGSSVSKVALHKRFNAQAVLFLEMLLNSVSQTLYWEHSGGYRKVLGQFGRVLIYDSTAWNISPQLAAVFPGSGGSGSLATCKLQLEYELKSGKIAGHDLGVGNIPDYSYAPQIAESAEHRDLCLFDLGYFTHELLEELEDKGAYFICRLKANTTVVNKQGNEIPLVRILKKARKQGKGALELLADLNGEGLEVRIVAVRLSEEKRRERIAQLKKMKSKKGQTLSKASREFAGWCVYATNACAQILPAAVVSELYRLRWSIELLFRQFKSVLKLDHATHANEHRLRCEILAKLIVAVIATALHGQLQAVSYRYRGHELSLQKVFQLLQRKADALLAALAQCVSTTRRFLQHIEKLIFRWCKKEYSRPKPSTLQRIVKAAARRTRFQKGVSYGFA